MNKMKAKRTLSTALLVLFLGSMLTSCHREGCPNEITKVDVQTEQDC